MTIVQKTKVGFEPVKPLTGSTVHVQRREDLFDPDVVAECRKMLNERVVLVFPEAHLTDQEQVTFTEMMGPRVTFTKHVNVDNENDVYQVTLDRKINKSPEYVLGTFFWHMDGMTNSIPPPKASLLTCRRTAPKGGQTEFASTFASYAALPEEEKTELEGLRVIHSVIASVREVATPDELDPSKRDMQYERPLVWTNRHGRKSLLIGSTADYVVGMPKPESRALFARLLEWSAQPAFTYRHRWREGDLVVWQNCGILHRVIPYAADSGRAMRRTSIAGVEAVA